MIVEAALRAVPVVIGLFSNVGDNLVMLSCIQSQLLYVQLTWSPEACSMLHSSTLGQARLGNRPGSLMLW